MRETKQILLEESTKLFLEKSFKEVTLKDILDKTGIAKGSFYYYFKSKEQLFIEIVDNFLLMLSDVIPVKKLEGVGIKDFIDLYLEATSKYIKKIKTLYEEISIVNINYYRLMFDAMIYYPGFKQKFDKMNEDEFNLWIKVIENAKKNKEIKENIDSTVLAKQFIHLYDGLGMSSVFNNDIENLNQNAKKMLGDFLEYIER